MDTNPNVWEFFYCILDVSENAISSVAIGDKHL